jgi:hypothetical protein
MTERRIRHQGARHHAARRQTSRRQAVRMAVLAFVAADCAGIWYAHQRLSQPSAELAQFAYQTPGAPVEGAAAMPAFAAAQGPALALAEPRAAAALATPSASLTAAPAQPVAEAAPARPAQTMAPMRAVSAAVPALATAEPQAGVSHKAAVASTADVFDNAFSLADEAPESEHRFGQDDSTTAAGTGSLADLVAPRDEPAPIFDKAGIAPVTGEAATVETPAAANLPAAAAATELPAIKG